MARKATLAMVLMLGFMMPACGGSSGPGGFCNDLVSHILSVCDTEDAAEAAMLEQFLVNVGGGTLTLEDLAADNGAAAKDECTEGFSEGEFDQEAADALIVQLEATTTCEGALTVAAALAS